MNKTYLINDICDVGSSKRIYLSEYQNTGIPFYRGKEIIEKEANKEISNELFISQEKYDEIKKKYGVPKIGDILMTAVGTIGISWYVDESDFYFKDGNLIWFKKFREDIINSKYLYYIFKSRMFNELIKNISIGSTQKAITIEQTKKIELSIPSINIQDKIVSILDNIDKKIILNNQINNNLQNLINSIFVSKFVNFDGYNGDLLSTEIGNIPKNWRVDDFGNATSFSNGYGWNSKDMLEKSEPDTYKIFKMGNIKIGGGIDKEKTKSWISKKKCIGLEQFLSKKGDILMCMTDMKNSENPLLGHTAIIDQDDEFVINQRVGIVRCNKKIRWPYIYTMTNLPFFINNIRSKAHSGVQVNLTTSGICDTKILIPDEDSLNKFYKVVIPMYEEIFALDSENENLCKLRDALLPKLMNGEIDLDNVEI